MIKTLRDVIAWPIAALLLFFTARRWLFLIFALQSRQAHDDALAPTAASASVLLLVPVRNEAETLPVFCSALDRLNYPVDKLTVVFINDGSTDASAAILQQWTAQRAHWHTLSLEQNRGKANALNVALTRFTQGDIIAIYDADEQPAPDVLTHLVAPFAEVQVGAVSGQRAVGNSLASPAASYTAFETLVHQFITMGAKDRLDLAPALLGSNCAYRRTALAQVGNFKPGALLEDSDLTVKLAAAGWRTRFEPRAVSTHHVPETIAGYWKQHTRWARGFADVAEDQASAFIQQSALSWPLRLELLIFSLGYLDRVALLIGGGLALFGSRLARRAVAITLLTPLLQVLAALYAAQAPVALWRRIFWLPLFFGLDIAMAVSGFWGKLTKMPQVWEERRARR
ncbi:MAG: glycosyltransferase family 2 protein [Anaerolineae bacterium]|nr:glycosyltransferase family 2 protein [Anaerolineae bacterium]